MAYLYSGVTPGGGYGEERSSNEPTNVGVTPITVSYDSVFMQKCLKNNSGSVYPVTDPGDSHSVRQGMVGFQLMSTRGIGKAQILTSVANIPHDAIPGVNLENIKTTSEKILGPEGAGQLIADVLNNSMGIVGIMQNITGAKTPMLINTAFRGGKYRQPAKDRRIRPGDRTVYEFLSPATLQIGMASMKAAGYGENFCGPVLARASAQGFVQYRMNLMRQVLSNPLLPALLVNKIQLPPQLSPLIATNLYMECMLIALASGLGFLVESRMLSLFNSATILGTGEVVRSAFPGTVDANRFTMLPGDTPTRSSLPSMTGVSSSKLARLLCCDVNGNDIVGEDGALLSAETEGHLVPNDGSTFTTMLLMIFGIVPAGDLRSDNPLINHLRVKLTEPENKELATAITTALSRTIMGFPDETRTYEVYQPFAYVNNNTLSNRFVRGGIGMPPQPDTTTCEGYALAKCQEFMHGIMSCEQFFHDSFHRNYFGIAYEGVNLEGQCGVVAAP